MKRSRIPSALAVAAGLLLLNAPASDAGFVTSFEVGMEPLFQSIEPVPADMLQPFFPDGFNLGPVDLRFIPGGGFAVPFPDGTNTMTIAEGAAIATVGLIDFYYGPDNGLYELAFPGAIWFDQPVENLSFTFWSIIQGVNGGFATVQAFDAAMNPLGDPVLPNAVVLDGAVGIEDLVSFDGPVSHLEWTITGMPALGEGWGIDFVSASTIPEPGTALLMGLGVIALGARKRAISRR